MRGVASVYASYLLQQCADVPVEMEDVEHHVDHKASILI
jgi:hypothetical protein